MCQRSLSWLLTNTDRKFARQVQQVISVRGLTMLGFPKNMGGIETDDKYFENDNFDAGGFGCLRVSSDG